MTPMVQSSPRAAVVDAPRTGLATDALVVDRPGSIALRRVRLRAPGPSDVVVRTDVTGISTGTEKLLFDGSMPPFPGLSYPLVPGYEAVGTVVDGGDDATLPVGTRVFVPGSSHYADGVTGLFGASAATLVTGRARVTPVGDLAEEHAALLALAATAMHAFTLAPRRAGASPSLADLVVEAPDVVVGHGVLGRLIARIAVALGADAPLVLETDAARAAGAAGYEVVHPDELDPARGAFRRTVDVSGAGGEHLNRLVARTARGGRITLAGFYPEALRFDFPPAFMRELVIDVAAEWAPEDLGLVLALTGSGALSLDGLVSDRASATDAARAYPDAFAHGERLKTVLDWRDR